MFTNTRWRDYLEGSYTEGVACFALLIAWWVKLFEVLPVTETWDNPRHFHLYLGSAVDRTFHKEDREGRKAPQSSAGTILP